MNRSNFNRFIPAAIFGFFAARFLYEFDPIHLYVLGDWPGTLGLAAFSVLAFFLLQFVARRFHISLSQFSLNPLYALLIYILWPQVDLRLALTLLLGAIFLTVHKIILSTDRFALITVGSIVFILYLLTLGDHVGRADTFEFQVVAPQLGIAHPTGYPLFILIGKLFSFLPIGSMAWRINLTSALFGTIAVVLVYRLIVVLLNHCFRQVDPLNVRLTAAIAAIALAASNVFWSQAVIAEVYALDAMLIASILTLLVKLIVGPSSVKTVYVLMLVWGLAITHHLDSIILLPAIFLTLILDRRTFRLQQRLFAIGYLLLGLTPWFYLPLRWPALHTGAAMTLSEWTGWIFAQRFSGALNLSLWSDPTRWGIVSRIVIEQFGIAGSLLALIGLIELFKHSWRVALITLGALAGYIFYGLVYTVPDVDVFIIPAFIILAVWLGVAVYELSSFISHYSLRITPYALRTTFIMLASLIPLGFLATNFPLVNQRGVDADQEAWGRYVLSLPIPDHAALLVDSEKIAPLYYLQVTEHLRPDLDILVLGDEALYRQELDQRLAAGQPVYLARFLPNLPYHLRSLGPLIEVSNQPGFVARNLQISPRFGDAFDLASLSITEGNPIRVTFGWQALTDARPNYHLRLQLVDAQGRSWWEDTGAHPVNGYYPTGMWSKGETVADYHEIKLDPFVPSGDYTLRVGFFTPFRTDGLKTADGTPWYEIQALHVQSIDVPAGLAHETRSVYASSFVLTSDDVLGVVPPSSVVSMRVNAAGEATSNSTSLSIVNSRGLNISTTQPIINIGQSRFEFVAPAASGRYTLRLSLQQPARCQWLAPITADCEIGTFEVAGEAFGQAINFDNQVLLMEAKIDRNMAKPNESIHIDLSWRGLKTWSSDYTAFVHLIGPDGKVHGQVDQWPVQGTLPTSSWLAGQTVVDPYVVTLPPDAPSGKYQVEVGWYLLATLRRLSVLDSSGRPSDDHVIVGEFSVP